MSPVPEVSGAYDLNKIKDRIAVQQQVQRNRLQHQHRWILVGNFSVDEKVLAKMAESKLAYRNALERGEEPTPPGINLPLDREHLLGVDGPGCQKCGAHWEMPENEDGFGGWGFPCPVSDEAFAAAGEPVRTPPPAQEEA